jgi:hypothetical protein
VLHVTKLFEPTEQVGEPDCTCVPVGAFAALNVVVDAAATATDNATTTPSRAAAAVDRLVKNPLGIAAFLSVVHGRIASSRVPAGLN